MIDFHNLSNLELLAEFNKFANASVDIETVGIITIVVDGHYYNGDEYNEIVAEFKKEIANRGFNNIILS